METWTCETGVQSWAGGGGESSGVCLGTMAFPHEAEKRPKAWGLPRPRVWDGKGAWSGQVGGEE